MTEKELADNLRKKYSESPPEGLSRQDILHMSDNDLLDMWIFRCAESACPVFWKSPVRIEEIIVPEVIIAA